METSNKTARTVHSSVSTALKEISPLPAKLATTIIICQGHSALTYVQMESITTMLAMSAVLACLPALVAQALQFVYPATQRHF